MNYIRRFNTNNSGSALVLFISTVPLLLSGFAFLVFSIASLNLKADGLDLCRRGLIKSQKKVGTQLSALLGLNSKATRLRWALSVAKTKLKIAMLTGNAPAIVLAQARVTLILYKQTLLAIQQKKIIFDTKVHTLRAKYKIKDQFLQLGNLSKISIQHPPLMVSFSPINSISPSYKIISQQAHASKVSWSYPLNHFVPHWIHEFADVTKLNITGYCQTTLTKEKGIWTAILQKDKLWLRP